ncbi:hypothetical protein GFK87_00029 [Candidatus Annandia pinicola]|nr:hypothetical protein GFK87_00029 [Candidatus Annandia pinicola]
MNYNNKSILKKYLIIIIDEICNINWINYKKIIIIFIYTILIILFTSFFIFIIDYIIIYIISFLIKIKY